MKKKGFTLIEAVVSLAIVSILFLVSFRGFIFYKNHTEKIQNTSAIYNVKGILSFSKKFCYENEQAGEIYFDNCDNFNEIYFVSKGKVIKKIDNVGDLRILNSNYVSQNKRIILLKVNSNGYIDPFTIKIIDKNNLIKEIVIQVGGNLIYIKDE